MIFSWESYEMYPKFLDLNLLLNSKSIVKYINNIDTFVCIFQVCKARQFWTPPTVKRIKMCVERLLAINIPLPCVLCTVELVQDMQRLCVKVKFCYCGVENVSCGLQAFGGVGGWGGGGCL